MTIALLAFLASTLALEVAVVHLAGYALNGLVAVVGLVALQIVVGRFCSHGAVEAQESVAVAASFEASRTYCGLLVAGLYLNSAVALAGAFIPWRLAR